MREKATIGLAAFAMLIVSLCAFFLQNEVPGLGLRARINDPQPEAGFSFMAKISDDQNLSEHRGRVISAVIEIKPGTGIRYQMCRGLGAIVASRLDMVCPEWRRIGHGNSNHEAIGQVG